jgi:cytochrome c oxidase subunit 3
MPVSLQGGVILTLLLAGASALVEVARRARGPRARWPWLAVAAVGATFLVLAGWEWQGLSVGGTVVGDTLAADYFYVLTGFHGLHVVAGVVLALFAAGTPSPTGLARPLAIYWHFVDAVWLTLFLSLYVP